MTDNNELNGLGGWLILVGIRIVIAPIRMLATLIPTYIPIFQKGTWKALTTVGSDSYTPYFGSLIIGEIAFNAVLMAASIYLIYLFFSKHYFFPKLFIGIVASSLAFILTDAWIATFIFPGEPIFDPDTTKEFTRSLIYCLVWIPYMLISKRVRATFVKGRPIEYAHETPRALSPL